MEIVIASYSNKYARPSLDHRFDQNVYYGISDIEDWENHAEIIPDEIIDTGCKKCEGYGELFYTRQEPNAPVKSEPITDTDICPNCMGRGYLNIQEHFEQK